MSDAEAKDRPTSTVERSVPAGPLSHDAIESLLSDFRDWLSGLNDSASINGGLESGQSPIPDIFSLVAQFTALRHEVNMQTRAVRSAVEQNAEILNRFQDADEAPQQEPESGEDLRPVAKAIVDISDALALSLNQIARARESTEPLLDELISPQPTPSRGFLARLFAITTGARGMAASDERAKQVVGKLRQLFAAANDGYAMSLRRVERLLPTLELESFDSTGQEFDPELMEVVEVVDAPDVPAGAVVEEVRPGYLWRGRVLRYAQVKVAR